MLTDFYLIDLKLEITWWSHESAWFPFVSIDVREPELNIN